MIKKIKNKKKLANPPLCNFVKKVSTLMESRLPMRSQEISLPHGYWNILSPEDKTEFVRLRAQFLQGQKISSKDRRIVTFRKELVAVLKYIERSETHKEERSVLVGVCFAGPIICVNTRQLKSFLGRCKSSINGSFQQMGYVALRTKAKARACVVAVMPSLQNEQNILKQWTVRCVSNEAQFCFLSSFSHIELPTITEEDLYDEKKPSSSTGGSSPNVASSHFVPKAPAAHSTHFQPNLQMQMQYQQFHPMTTQQAMMMQQHQSIPQQPPQTMTTSSAFMPQQQRPTIPAKPKMIEFDLPAVDDLDTFDSTPKLMHPDLSTSLSVDCFPAYGDGWDDVPSFETPSFEWDPAAPTSGLPTQNRMTHSNSAFLPSFRDWDLFDDY